MPHALTSRDSTMESKPLGSYPPSGIDILIVGTGLAGLVAALDATRFLKHWPELLKEYKEISLHNAWIETFKHSGEVIIPPKKVADRLRAVGLDPDTPPGEFQMRPLVYRMFVNAVEKLGVSVEFNRKVVDYFEDEHKGGCITDDGKRYEADVVIAADGVGSKSQKLVGGQVRARPSGRAMWRAAFPKEALDVNPKVKEFFKMMPGDEPIVRTWLGWNNTIDKEEVLKGMDEMPGMEVHKWAPIFRELVDCTPPNTIVNFELLWRNPQPSWTSPGARVIQIGDAAHSYLPASGNGATQAIEDAISIASCLQIGGKENIPQSVRVHIRFRFIRNSCAQKLGFSNAELLQDTDWDKVKLDPRRAQPKLPKWVWGHDPEAYAYENYEKSAASMKKGVDMKDEDSFEPNYPKGYTYEPWSIEKVMEDMRAGKPIDLGPGDWE
ncbi:hypothetical protein J1614_007983 [Plenodomus biglobosus]|nr:hypothetical protein J1614_007983 [Plenodomus biglobosus]